MSKSVIDNTTVAQNINTLLSVEDTPMNENITIAQLNTEAKAEETKEKKEKYSLSRASAELVSEIEKALSGNAAQIKALGKALGVLLSAGLDTGPVLAKIDALRKESVEITPEFEAKVGRAFIEIIRAKNAQ